MDDMSNAISWLACYYCYSLPNLSKVTSPFYVVVEITFSHVLKDL